MSVLSGTQLDLLSCLNVSNGVAQIDNQEPIADYIWFVSQDADITPELYQYCDNLFTSNLLVLDLETYGVEMPENGEYKRKQTNAQSYKKGKTSGLQELALSPIYGDIRLLQLASLSSDRVLVVDFKTKWDRPQLSIKYKEFIDYLIEKIRQFAKKKGVFIGHNIGFDLGFLRAKYEIKTWKAYDTMIMSQLLSAGILTHKHGLKDCCDRYLGIYVDKTEQLADNSLPLRNAQINYAASDIVNTGELFVRLRQEIKLAELEEVTEIEADFTPALVEINYWGMPVDLAELDRQIKWYFAKLMEIEKEFVATYPFMNIRSSKIIATIISKINEKLAINKQQEIEDTYQESLGDGDSEKLNKYQKELLRQQAELETIANASEEEVSKVIKEIKKESTRISGKPVQMVYPLKMHGEANPLPVNTTIDAMRGFGRCHTTRTFEPYKAYGFKEGDTGLAVSGNISVAFKVGRQYRITKEMIYNLDYQHEWANKEKHSVQELLSFSDKPEVWGLEFEPLGDYFEGEIKEFPERNLIGFVNIPVVKQGSSKSDLALLNDQRVVQLVVDFRTVSIYLNYCQQVKQEIVWIEGVPRVSGSIRQLTRKGQGRTCSGNKNAPVKCQGVNIQNPPSLKSINARLKAWGCPKVRDIFKAKQIELIPKTELRLIAQYQSHALVWLMDFRIVDVDLPAAHLAIATYMSGEQDVEEGVDRHAITMKCVFDSVDSYKEHRHLSIKDITAINKKDDHNLFKKFTKIRSMCKNVVYSGLNFGSAPTLQTTIKTNSNEEVALPICEAMTEAFPVILPKIAELRETLWKKANDNKICIDGHWYGTFQDDYGTYSTPGYRRRIYSFCKTNKADQHYVPKGDIANCWLASESSSVKVGIATIYQQGVFTEKFDLRLSSICHDEVVLFCRKYQDIEVATLTQDSMRQGLEHFTGNGKIPYPDMMKNPRKLISASWEH